MQAIQYFTDGCKEGTLLKHKLVRREVSTMAKLMTIADKYAIADSAMEVSVRLSPVGQAQQDRPAAGQSGQQNDNNNNPGAGLSRRERRLENHGKRKDEQ